LPTWSNGAVWLMVGFVAVNLLILMEVADRLSLKGELEIARDIQLAMLPSGLHRAGDTVICGITRPANTVGGDFYDIIPLPNGRLVLAIGDVAGKGSPAALLMALLLAMLRTLVDEGLEAGRLIERLNVQVARHSPASRFITFFYAIYDPATGLLQFVNAGHLAAGGATGGRAIRSGYCRRRPWPRAGMFESATYQTSQLTIGPGDMLVLYTDGITEAENPEGKAFEESGLEAVIARTAGSDPVQVGRAILAAVDSHAADARLGDDLTALVISRAPSVALTGHES
jgi:sigma-B regulation protein RsbU (phosphoserine phosphatase)